MIFEKIREKIEEKAFSVQLKQGIKEPSTFDAMEEKFSVREIKDIINQVEAEYNQTVTNADRIRHMTDEELAQFLLKVNTAYAEPCMISSGDCKYEDYPTHDKGCKDCFLEYLRKEVEG